MTTVNSILKALREGDNVRDYAHASRTFVEGNFDLHPRVSFLFHVVFNFTPEAASIFDNLRKLEIPLLVKSTDLPTFSIDVKNHNQYNRSVTSLHKITYNDLNIKFHDDQKDIIRELWHAYYAFYYGDPRYQVGSRAYTTDDRYGTRGGENWGFQNGNVRFFQDIRIYSMHQQKFAEYTLVNPVISSFNHGNHDYSARDGILEHSMTLKYETVKYATGFVNSQNPKGFGEIRYDKRPSPIGVFGRGPSNSILFPGGLLDGVNTVAQDLFGGNLLGAIVKGAIIFNNTRDADFGKVIMNDINRAVSDISRGRNIFDSIVIPNPYPNPTTANDLARTPGISPSGSSVVDWFTPRQETTSNGIIWNTPRPTQI